MDTIRTEHLGFVFSVEKRINSWSATEVSELRHGCAVSCSQRKSRSELEMEACTKISEECRFVRLSPAKFVAVACILFLSWSGAEEALREFARMCYATRDGRKCFRTTYVSELL